jgi:hypothetical protein
VGRCLRFNSVKKENMPPPRRTPGKAARWRRTARPAPVPADVDRQGTDFGHPQGTLQLPSRSSQTVTMPARALARMVIQAFDYDFQDALRSVCRMVRGSGTTP